MMSERSETEAWTAVSTWTTRRTRETRTPVCSSSDSALSSCLELERPELTRILHSRIGVLTTISPLAPDASSLDEA
jgi:hypothetical protein